ncbi:MAG TPA: ribosome recycling factor [Syntrophales bacterium]|nr:ribosome recycling factor [Syntrophobacterales bacterium]HRT28013.1 ribosome recycling factor [Syntrophales bacterium]HRT70983.1 ribosome recycling factor [Syntrophales bacterium]
MNDRIGKDLKAQMEGILNSLEKSLGKIRTGRASLSLLDGIKVDYYGSPTPLNQVASFSIPESRQILISPWDPGALNSIEKALLKSELGLTPNNDGKLIRINIPPLTEERRKELVKVVKKMGEDAKIKLRNARRDTNEQLKALKKENSISEDELFKQQGEVQKLTDEYIKRIDEIIVAKEKEIMEI